MTPPLVASIPRNSGEQNTGRSGMSAATGRIIERAGLSDIAHKLQCGERLHIADGLRLFDTVDLAAVGALANRVRQSQHGDLTSFTHLTEPLLGIGIPGSGRTLSEQLQQVRRIRQEWPDALLRGFTAGQIHDITVQTGAEPTEILQRLLQAGLDGLGGGGTEVLHPGARRRLAHPTVPSDRWLHIHRAAHQVGLRSTATLLFGSVETPRQRLAHLLQLRQVQDETHGFDAFVPLKRRLDPGLPRTPREAAGADSLRTLAISRLMLDNMPSIVAHLPMFGLGLAETSLHFGADAVDTYPHEQGVHQMASLGSGADLAARHIIALIQRAGRVPVERDIRPA